MIPFLIAAAVGGIAFVATRDENYRVERSVSVQAPPEDIFSVLADFRLFEHWSPWERHDPTMHKEFDGQAGEVGTSYSWSGNNKVGQGKMTIVEVQPNEGLDLRLEFFKPWASICSVRWAVTREGDLTIVTWTMKGKNQTFAKKFFGLLLNMQKMLGRDFDAGLARLKAYCESPDFQKKPQGQLAMATEGDMKD